MMDVILCNLLHNPRTEVVTCVHFRSIIGAFLVLFSLILLDMFVNTDLLSHDALNVNLIGVVVVLD